MNEVKRKIEGLEDGKVQRHLKVSSNLKSSISTQFKTFLVAPLLDLSKGSSKQKKVKNSNYILVQDVRVGFKFFSIPIYTFKS